MGLWRSSKRRSPCQSRLCSQRSTSVGGGQRNAEGFVSSHLSQRSLCVTAARSPTQRRRPKHAAAPVPQHLQKKITIKTEPALQIWNGCHLLLLVIEGISHKKAAGMLHNPRVRDSNIPLSNFQSGPVPLKLYGEEKKKRGSENSPEPETIPRLGTYSCCTKADCFGEMSNTRGRSLFACRGVGTLTLVGTTPTRGRNSKTIPRLSVGRFLLMCWEMRRARRAGPS